VTDLSRNNASISQSLLLFSPKALQNTQVPKSTAKLPSQSRKEKQDTVWQTLMVNDMKATLSKVVWES
jgi:hypothetical protein